MYRQEKKEFFAGFIGTILLIILLFFEVKCNEMPLRIDEFKCLIRINYVCYF